MNLLRFLQETPLTGTALRPEWLLSGVCQRHLDKGSPHTG